MKIKIMVHLTHDEIVQQIPYGIVCETMYGAKWNTGRRKRMFAKEFSESERRSISRLRGIAYEWALKKGAPNEVKMTHKTYLLWKRLGDFCYEIY